LNKKTKPANFMWSVRLLQDIDAYVKRKGYLSRSEFVKEAVKEKMLRDQMERKSQ